MSVKTRAGCTVSVERVGASVGVTVVQAGGKRDLFACGADEAGKIGDLLVAEALRKCDVRCLDGLDCVYAFGHTGPHHSRYYISR